MKNDVIRNHLGSGMGEEVREEIQIDAKQGAPHWYLLQTCKLVNPFPFPGGEVNDQWKAG